MSKGERLQRLYIFVKQWIYEQKNEVQNHSSSTKGVYPGELSSMIFDGNAQDKAL